MLTTIKRLALIALFVAAAVPASAQDASWDAVVAAAKQEGKLVLYNMSAGAPSAICRASVLDDSKLKTTFCPVSFS